MNKRLTEAHPRPDELFDPTLGPTAPTHAEILKLQQPSEISEGFEANLYVEYKYYHQSKQGVN